MYDLISFIKKLFGMNNESKRVEELLEVQPTPDSDTYVPQVYIDTVTGKVEKNEFTELQNKMEDAETFEVGESVSSQEPIEEFVLSNHSSAEFAENNHNCNRFVVNDGTRSFVNVEGLLNSLTDIIEEYDSYLQRVDNEEVKQIIELLQHRLLECISANGVRTIKDVSEFNCLEHVSVPFAIIKDGTPIKEVKRVGLVWNDTVLLKAQVII